jgi:hypothetical protein
VKPLEAAVAMNLREIRTDWRVEDSVATLSDQGGLL